MDNGNLGPRPGQAPMGTSAVLAPPLPPSKLHTPPTSSSRNSMDIPGHRGLDAAMIVKP